LHKVGLRADTEATIRSFEGLVEALKDALAKPTN
jgi:hypothetical protein